MTHDAQTCFNTGIRGDVRKNVMDLFIRGTADPVREHQPFLADRAAVFTVAIIFARSFSSPSFPV